MFITDLDDTFLNSKAGISNEVKQRINFFIQSGLLFSFVTARDWDSAYEITEEIGINLPVAVFNGAAVIDFNSKRILQGKYIPISSLLKVIEIANKDQVTVNINYNYKGKVRKIKNYSSQMAAVDEMNKIKNVLSCSIIGCEEDILNIYNQILSSNISGIKLKLYSDPVDIQKILDIVALDSSKGIAVEYIRKWCHYEDGLTVVAFGNEENDIELLKTADIGVAVGDVPLSLYKYADIHLEYNDGLSVVNFLENYYKEGKKLDKYKNSKIVAEAYWNSKKIVDEFSKADEPYYWKEFFGSIKHPEDIIVLDLGCGGGRNTSMLADLGFKVEACDLHLNMTKATEMRIQGLGRKKENVHIQQANMLKLPFDTESMDIVLSNGIYHNSSSVDEFKQAIQESIRVLKNNGILCLNVFTDSYIDDTLVKQKENSLFLTPDGLDMVLLSERYILDLLKNFSVFPYSEPICYKSEINVGIRSVLRGVFFKK